MPGDLVYWWMNVPDVERAERFYTALLGWEIAPGNVPEGRQVTNVSPPGGMHGGQPAGENNLCFEVDDLDAARAKVAELGGEPGEPQPTDQGAYVDCRDDQGVGFCVWASSS